MKNTIRYTHIIQFISAVLIVLWVYTAFSKLADFSAFQKQMRNQVFGRGAAEILAFMLPGVELFTAALLSFPRSRKFGLLLSALMLLLFTLYISLILLHVFPRVPCSCGGVLQSMGWHAHLWFNLANLLLAIIGSWLSLKRKEVSE